MPKDKKAKAYVAAGNYVAAVMHERKKGILRSGSDTGPKVTDRKQAIAIGLSEQRKAESSKNKKSGQDSRILGSSAPSGGPAGTGQPSPANDSYATPFYSRTEARRTGGLGHDFDRY